MSANVPEGIKTLTRNLNIRWKDDRDPAPENVEFTYDQSIGQYILENVDSTMEYRLQSASNTAWQPCLDTPMAFDVSTTNKVYYVRYKATASNDESQTKIITLKARPAAPSCTYNTSTELISGLNTDMEMSINNGAYSPVTGTTYDLSSIINNLTTDPAAINIRKKATAVLSEGAVKTFTVYPRLSGIPSSVTYNQAAIALDGTSTAMEYKLKTATSWTAAQATTTDLKALANSAADAIVELRFKPTSTNSASQRIEFTIPKLAEGPSGTIDYVSESITGLENGVAYQYNTSASPAITSTSWKNAVVENGNFSIAGYISSSAKFINLRKAATSNSPVSEYTTFNFPARPSAPSTPVFVYNDLNNYDKAVLTGITSEMEYRLSTVAEWTSVSGTSIVFDVPAANATYYVRIKPAYDRFGSYTKSLTLSKSGSAPSVSYNSTTEILSGLTTAMEISINGSTYSPITATTLNLTDMINQTNGAISINVRKPAVATAPASLPKVFTVYPRLNAPSSVTFNQATTSLDGTTTAMAYKLKTATSWTAATSTSTDLKPLASAAADVVVEVRFMPTSTNSASHSIEFTIPKLVAGPSGTIDYANETITGLENGVAYQYNTSSSPTITATTWKNATVDNGSFSISSFISSSAKFVHLRKAATSTSPVSEYTTFNFPARPSAPSTPVLVYNDSNNYEKAVLTGVNSGMEYRLSTNTEWTGISGTSIVLDIPVTAAETYYVRNIPANDRFGSYTKSLTLSKAGSTPSVYYNATTETLTSLTTAMEISINGSTYSPITATTLNLTDMINQASGMMTINVRKTAIATAPASLPKIFTIYPRLNVPTAVTYNQASTSLNGTTTAMEYKLKTATAWTAAQATTTNLKSLASSTADVIVELRFKPTSTNSASHSIEFTIPKLVAGPSGTIDYANETITGLETGVAYQYNTSTSPTVTATTWKNATVDNGSFSISSFISSSAKFVHLRKAETSNSPVSEYTTFNFPARPSAPTTPVFVYNDSNNYGKAVLTGITGDMEYRLSTITDWTSVSGTSIVFDVPMANATYYVRIKPSNDRFGSYTKSLTLTKEGSAPSVSYNSTTEMLSSLTTAMEISINGSSYSPITATTFSLTGTINQASGATTVNVRKTAVASAPASLPKVFTVYPRSSAPSSVTFNQASTSLNGTTTAMEYKLKTATAWTAAKATTTDLKSLASSTADVIVELRFKPTSTNSASQSIEFIIPKLVTGPNGTIDYTNELITGLENGVAYQYCTVTSPTSTSTWTNAAITNGSFNINGFIATSARVVHLRKAATSTAPASGHTTFNLPARTSAPTSPVFAYNVNPDVAVLSGVTEAMEYKLSTDNYWTSGTGLPIAFNIPSANLSYQVRSKATDVKFCSLIKSLTLLKAGNAPSSTYNATTQIISGLSTAMEISINGGAYFNSTASTYNMASIISNYAPGETINVNIRIRATATAPASLIKSLVITVPTIGLLSEPLFEATEETTEAAIEEIPEETLLETTEETIEEPITETTEEAFLF